MILTGKQKSVAAFVLALIGGVATVLLMQLPDNDTVQLWCGIVSAIVTAVATTLGVYQVSNTPAPLGPEQVDVGQH